MHRPLYKTTSRALEQTDKCKVHAPEGYVEKGGMQLVGIAQTSLKCKKRRLGKVDSETHLPETIKENFRTRGKYSVRPRKKGSQKTPERWSGEIAYVTIENPRNKIQQM